jgi:small subunit ribosomal protein S4e
MHRTRKKAPRAWGLKNKGTKYVVRGSGKYNVPLTVVLRDILKFAQTRKEVKAILHNDYVKINNQNVKDEKFVLKLNDILSLKEKSFRVVFNEFRKFELVEISDKEKNEKIAKVIDKRLVNPKEYQINLNDGRNYTIESKVEISIGDSCIIDLKNKKIKEILKVKTKSPVVIIKGKHLGRKGVIKEVDEAKKTVLLETKEGELNIKMDQIMVEK